MLLSILTRAHRRALRTTRRYRSEADGATAMEFGILAIPFLMLMFGIIELALIFFTGSALANAVSDTGRKVRVGAFENCGGMPEFKSLVCDRMKNLMNCEANLRIDVESETKFVDVAFEDPTAPDKDDPDAEVEDGVWTDTTAGDPVVIRATFYYPLILPPGFTRLENDPGTGRRVLTSSTAFRNEPFPSSTNCSATTQADLDRIKDAKENSGSDADT